MSAFVIFGSSLMAIIFFLLSIFLKGVLAAIFGIGHSLKILIKTLSAALTGIVMLYTFYFILEGIRQQSVWGIIGLTLLLFVEIAVVLIVISYVGKALRNAVVETITLVFEKLTWFINQMARWTGKMYDRFLSMIVQKI